MLRRVAAELLAVLVPPACATCRSALLDAEEVMCAECRRTLPWLRGPRCPRCALPAPCGRWCPARSAAFATSWSPLAHAGPARAAVGALKFHGALGLADLMAAAMAANAPGPLLANATLVPVPAHPRRRRQRGFDHAERLTAALAARSGRPLGDVLRRGTGGGAQLGARRDARLHAHLHIEMAGAAPREALLVDDVHTTGATLDACARALRAGGSRSVAAVTYTRTLRTGSPT